MKFRKLALALSSLALAATSFAANAADHVFSNAAPIAVPGAGTSGPGSPYPSTINVAGLTGNVDNVRVTLSNMSHTFPLDIDIMLVSPGGQQVMLMSDTGGANDINGVNLTFSASAAAGLPNGTQISSGTYLPTNYAGFGDSFPAPAPAPTGATDLTVFDGPAASANGTWSLYVVDNAGADVGSIAGGWTLTLADAQSCAAEGYTGMQLTWCQNICEKEYSGATLDLWVRRWITRYRDLPYCASPG